MNRKEFGEKWDYLTDNNCLTFDNVYSILQQQIKEAVIKELENYVNSNKRPCKHKGCYNHISHPCEHCGRIQGNIPISIQIELLNRIKELKE